jgi:hypothetical protein
MGVPRGKGPGIHLPLSCDPIAIAWSRLAALAGGKEPLTMFWQRCIGTPRNAEGTHHAEPIGSTSKGDCS